MRVLLTMLCLLFLGASAAPAEGPEPPLQRAVREAEEILVGRVLGVEERRGEEELQYKVTLGVEETLKGEGTAQRVSIYFRPSPELKSEFTPGERCVVFVRTWEGRYMVLEGRGGKVLVQEGSGPLLMREGEETGDMEDLIRRIKGLARKTRR
jgi:hypothetical protein